METAFKKKDFVYLFLERGEGREKERERNLLQERQASTRPLSAAPQAGGARRPGSDLTRSDSASFRLAEGRPAHSTTPSGQKQLL